jgi:hypothetical protein
MDASCLATHAMPGMNRTTGDPDAIVCFNQPTPANLVERPVVLLATAPINKGSIFSNGLYQNIYIFYKLLESIGYLPFFLQNTEPGTVDEILQGHRTVGVEQLMQKPFPIHAYIEIGMSVDPNFRRFMKLLGARNVKIYLGNILNIDVETSQFYSQMFFNHHVVGEMDEIWVSPHYEQHREYAAILNKVYDPAAAKIVPYVWDPCFITRFGTATPKWQPAAPGARETIILMEPNISFQKCSLIPLLALNQYKRKNPSWDPQIIVVNGHRLVASPHFQENVKGTLVIEPVYRERASIVDLLRDYPSATFICNQVNNEYNYMVMELLFCGFPVIHNGETWAPYGYYYAGNSISKLLAAFMMARGSYATGQSQKMSQAQTLFWRYSIHNPAVQGAWRQLVGWPAAAKQL